MKKIILAATALVIFAGCYNDKYDKLYPLPTTTTTTCDTTTITYTHDILPIITASCYNTSTGGCHGTGTTSGYDYTTFSVLQNNALSGWVVQDINFAATGRGHNNMPLNGSKLSACDINKITRWVNQGALNN